jgi:hypothetical protein
MFGVELEGRSIKPPKLRGKEKLAHSGCKMIRINSFATADVWVPYSSVDNTCHFSVLWSYSTIVDRTVRTWTDILFVLQS